MILFKLCEYGNGTSELRGLRIEPTGRVYTKRGVRPADFRNDHRWIRQCPGYAPEDVDAVIEEKLDAGWSKLDETTKEAQS